MCLFRLADGRIAEIWPLWDGLAMLRQLGHLEENPVPPNQRMHQPGRGPAVCSGWHGRMS